MRQHSVWFVSKFEIDSKFACIPRTSRLISSYSPPASLHLRYSALQNVTTITISVGDALTLISWFGSSLSSLDVKWCFKPPFSARNALISLDVV